MVPINSLKSLYLRQTALDEYFLANVAQRVGDRPSRNLAPDDDHMMMTVTMMLMAMTTDGGLMSDDDDR